MEEEADEGGGGVVAMHCVCPWATPGATPWGSLRMHLQCAVHERVTQSRAWHVHNCSKAVSPWVGCIAPTVVHMCMQLPAAATIAVAANANATADALAATLTAAVAAMPLSWACMAW